MDRPMSLCRRLLAALILPVVAPGAVALAQPVAAPRPWEIGMQPAFGPLKAAQIELHNLVLVIITLITLFVAALLIWVMWRYSAKRHPVPTRTSHNTVIEILWTVIPVLILVVMAIPASAGCSRWTMSLSCRSARTSACCRPAAT
jgi:cytochrome c oxidase subunit 2